MKQLRRAVLNYLTKKLYPGLTSDDILIVAGENVIIHKGKALSRDDAIRIKESAELFSKSAIWQYLKTDARYQAQLMMFERSTSTEDMKNGKMMLFLIEQLDKKLKELSH